MSRQNFIFLTFFFKHEPQNFLINTKEKKFSSQQPVDKPVFSMNFFIDVDEASLALTAIGLKRRELLAKTKSLTLPPDFSCTILSVHVPPRPRRHVRKYKAPSMH